MLRDYFYRVYRTNRPEEALENLVGISAIMSLVSYIAVGVLLGIKVLPIFLTLKIWIASMVMGYVLSAWSGFKNEGERVGAIFLGTIFLPGFIVGNILWHLVKLLKFIFSDGFIGLHHILSDGPKVLAKRVIKRGK
jgi:hypothetical protein